VHIAYTLDERITDRPTVLTMGKFDGLHRGHQQLIGTVITHARSLGFASAVLTWEPHPGKVLRPSQDLFLLTSLEEKIELIGELGPDFLIVAPFTTQTMATSAEDYLAQICAALPLRELWVGENFAMGRNRAGDVPALMAIGAQLGFAVGAMRPVRADDELPVSASRVRELLRAGDVAGAAGLLGRPFGIRGTVVEGDKRGRTIGFPTANLYIDPQHILPADGVYACRIHLDEGPLPAVANVGLRPTFDGTTRTVEAHILDWSGDLYGQVLRCDFHQRLRGEQKFNGIAELVAQIGLDAQRARELFGV
jgi:riboflavin kinase / FMN adenylyltransferase